MLALRVDFLNGVFRAADSSTPNLPEWPPHPDRLYQALVAAAYGCGIDPTPLRALEDFAPDIAYGHAHPAQNGTVFVPAAYKKQKKQTPVSKSDPLMVQVVDPVCFIWPQLPDELGARIADIAGGVTYLGRAKSPAAVSVVTNVPDLAWRITPSETGEELLRVPQPGRLDALDAAFAAGQRASVALMIGYADVRDPVAPSPWGQLLALRPGQFASMRHTSQLADAIRTAVLSKAGDDAPALLHGHAGDHAAWAVVPDVAHPHARGRVLGIGLWLPKGIADEDRTRCVLPLVQVDHVRFRGERLPVKEPPAHASDPHGLRRRTWARPSKLWASVTPLVLDRHPKKGKSLEAAVAESVTLAGFPQPSSVEVGQTAAFRGVPLAREFRPRSGGQWMHVLLAFEQRVAGPMLLGRDRHFGMGLMRPMEA